MNAHFIRKFWKWFWLSILLNWFFEWLIWMPIWLTWTRKAILLQATINENTRLHKDQKLLSQLSIVYTKRNKSILPKQHSWQFSIYLTVDNVTKLRLGRLCQLYNYIIYYWYIIYIYIYMHKMIRMRYNFIYYFFDVLVLYTLFLSLSDCEPILPHWLMVSWQNPFAGKVWFFVVFSSSLTHAGTQHLLGRMVLGITMVKG